MLAAQWFVVQTNPQKETFVEQRLKLYEPYLPRFKNMRGKVEPLFRNYIFTPRIPEVSYITHTVGVRGLLMAGDYPAIIPSSVITHWRSKERGGLVQLPPPPRFQPGQRLTITHGSLKYREVIYSGMSGKDRERVLIEMLGQYVSIRVPSAHLASDFRPPPRNSLHRRRETFTGQGTAQFSGCAV
jgi:hypothetical protein